MIETSCMLQSNLIVSLVGIKIKNVINFYTDDLLLYHILVNISGNKYNKNKLQMMQSYLKAAEICVQRNRIREILNAIDPIGTVSR